MADDRETKPKLEGDDAQMLSIKVKDYVRASDASSAGRHRFARFLPISHRQTRGCQ
jgi:hypothetical protein